MKAEPAAAAPVQVQRPILPEFRTERARLRAEAMEWRENLEEHQVPAHIVAPSPPAEEQRPAEEDDQEEG
ncbi:hypothetical protein DYB32_008973 [Aphanomyces invadans]|uniref:Uncharacterized protein n=1 Tax=Aphanomyces invadans TaxID=157072 RepID=A0A3R6YT49_9STRA|nr:hypothetical protein DYB32_008973 [Aphanomyces invadans]